MRYCRDRQVRDSLTHAVHCGRTTNGEIMASAHTVQHWPSRGGTHHTRNTVTAPVCARVLPGHGHRVRDGSPTKMQADQANRRILVIDDNAVAQEDLRRILAGHPDSETALTATRTTVSGGVPVAREAFPVDSAHSGQEALARVERALRRNRPYAMAFLNMRMSSGWDGPTTIRRLWQLDPQLQFALINADADDRREALTARLGADDRLLIADGPLNPAGIRQVASLLTTRRRTTGAAVVGMSNLASAIEGETGEPGEANLVVENGPVIFYRLRGEPGLSLLYISQGITRFGHDRDALLASSGWVEKLVDPRDRTRVEAAIARVLDRGVTGASVEFRLRTGDGACRCVENRFVPVRDREGRLIEIEGMILDVTREQAAEEKTARLAGTDALTGLANRTTFVRRLRRAFAAAQRGAMPFAVFHLGLDHFGSVNDTLGRAVGDLLLREVSKRLTTCMGERDLVARLGGDEFAILQDEMGEPANAGSLAARLRTALAFSYHLDGNDVRITTSIGVCPYVEGSSDVHALLLQAELALHRARQDGGNLYCFHSDGLDQSVLERMTLADDLSGAADRGELELQYQPEIELSSGNIVGMEALVRWHHPTRGLLAPGVFMPIAERTGTVRALGHWVLDEACRQMRVWRDEGVAPLMIAVNLSLRELGSAQTFIRDVAETVAKWRLAPSDLEFDVTEATLTRLAWSQNDVLRALRELGVKIAIDDFGSEYASFDYVRSWRVSHLKIAQSVIHRSTCDPGSAATIHAIVNLAREAGIGVIAQGVETEQQRLLLADTNWATKAQGFHFSEAVGAAEASALLRQGHIAEST
ncbi:PAS domain S-box-containing protein/diguanylate cyclase (GGDEF) domain-containing protein [Burkholderia sp. OK233]|nr:PAS domain S-box-containing protein/diguanylate cyclase (GGDEF) domain-containing protein [Burkholderia sp. OK233]